MAEIDWHRCRFLESTENLKPLVKRRFGKEPSASLAREIAACLQQGRLFYEAAVASPLEIRPLQLFYGMVSFSKALVIAHRLQALSTLKPAHGLKDKSDGGARIADLRVRIESSGNFQDFNDVAAELTRLCYTDVLGESHVLALPSAKSTLLNGVGLSLREILSRIPGLGSLYRMTFGEDAGVEYVNLEVGLNNQVQIQVEDALRITDRHSLKEIVERWRARFPFLKAWRLQTAYRAHGKSSLTFQNTSISEADEFADTYLIERTSGQFEQLRAFDQRFPLEKGLHSVATSYGAGEYAISPVQGFGLSEFTLQYLALFLLSSLVRYRPQTWIHAISRSVDSQTPADDKMLSLIELFLSINSTSVPHMVVTVLNPHEDYYFSQ